LSITRKVIMNHACFLLPLGLVVAIAATPQAAAAADATEPRPLKARITGVTVFADRAEVTRAAAFEPVNGVERLAFTGLPGWIDEGSVRVAATPPEAGQVLDVEIHRDYLARPSDAEFTKATLAVRDITDQIAVLDDERTILDAQSKQVEAIRLFSTEKMAKDALAREIKPAEYGESLKFIAGTLRETAVSRRELEKKRRELEPELAARKAALNELGRRAQLEQRTVVVTLRGGNRKGELRLTCMLPGATWEPVHELRASADGRMVGLASYAVVRQSSGEDWTGVDLSLSTQRSSETLKIPDLESLLVDAGHRIAHVTSPAASSFGKASDNYSKLNELQFSFNNSSVAMQQEYAANNLAIEDNSRRVQHLFDAVMERGTTAHFPALEPQTIRADGRPVRVPLGQADLAAQHRILASPALSLNAARVVDLANKGKQPILPGKVSIFLDGAFLGLTETEFVAAGESFSLYLGVADEIKLSRTLDKKHSELRRSGQRTRVLASFLLTAENLGDRPATIRLGDRVPVSESDEIKVSGVKITPEAKPDSKGLVKWDLTLAPRQAREFRLDYTLDYPTDTPMLSRAMPAHRPPTEGAAAGGFLMRNTPATAGQMQQAVPPPPTAPEEGQIHLDIQALERKF